VTRFTIGAGVHADDQRGDDPPHLPAKARRIGSARDHQVVDGAQQGERQRLGVGAGPDTAQLLLGAEVVGEMPLDIAEPARGACACSSAWPRSGFAATRLISAWPLAPNTATVASVYQR